DGVDRRMAFPRVSLGSASGCPVGTMEGRVSAAAAAASIAEPEFLAARDLHDPRGVHDHLDLAVGQVADGVEHGAFGIADPVAVAAGGVERKTGVERWGGESTHRCDARAG